MLFTFDPNLLQHKYKSKISKLVGRSLIVFTIQFIFSAFTPKLIELNSKSKYFKLVNYFKISLKIYIFCTFPPKLF